MKMVGPLSTFKRQNQDQSIFLEKSCFSYQLLSFVALKLGSLNEVNGTGGKKENLFKLVLHRLVAFSM